MQPHSEHPTLRKGKDVVQEKEVTQIGKGRGRGRDRSRPFSGNRNQSPHTNNEPRQKGKRKGRNQKGKKESRPRTSGDRKPQDPCSYCGGENHTARTCYKRQNDEKNGKTKSSHKQANLNVTIDETALMFQQTVVTVSNADQPSDTTRWRETVNPEEIEDQATNSDQESSKTVETDMTENHKGDNKESSYEREREDTIEYAEIVKTINTLPDNHYAWGYLDPTKAYYGNEHNGESESKVNKGRTDFINWYDMQIHNMAEIKATQFLMEYYDEPTFEVEASQEVNTEKGTSSKVKQAPEQGKDNGKQGNEEREPSIERATLAQLAHMEGGSEPVNDTDSLEKEAEESSSTEPRWERMESRKKKRQDGRLEKMGKH
jgi:hypothetical protein